MQDKPTSRVILSPLAERHGRLLFEAFSDPALYRFIPDKPAATADSLRADYRRRSLGAPSGCDEIWLNWAISLQPSAICIGRLEATVMRDGSAKLAYMLGKDYWRQGYAKEGCAIVIDLLRSAYQIKRFIIETDTRNISSIKLAESLGFQLTDTINAVDYFKGCSSDEYLFELN